MIGILQRRVDATLFAFDRLDGARGVLPKLVLFLRQARPSLLARRLFYGAPFTVVCHWRCSPNLMPWLAACATVGSST